MKVYLLNPLKSTLASFSKRFMETLFLLGCSASCFADVVLHGNQVINAPKTYNNVTLDLTDGRFTINAGGSLTVTNSTINVEISPSNPFFVQMVNGNLNLNNNKVNVTVSSISQTPDIKAAYQLVDIQQGGANLSQNTFTVNTPFTVGLLATQNILTNGLKINDNIITNFHGGIYLTNSNNAEVSRNQFNSVSFSNIFNNGNTNKFDRNIFIFPGNLHLGNAFDILNSSSVNITSNIISSGSNHGISITGGSNIFIENNKITDGQDFAIVINTPTFALINKNKYLQQFLPSASQKKIFFLDNDNIVISYNYIEQNKYGLMAGIVNRLLVVRNIFIQRFTDSGSRQFWTNNDNLLPNIAFLTWTDNEYKEAFTQENEGDNSISLQFVTFPKRGGVVLN